MQERIDIIVTERGSRTVKRSLEDLATSADRAGDETAELQRRLNAISPTAELAQTMRQMQALKTAMNQGGASSDWPRRPIADANAELIATIGRLNTIKSNMRDQTPWGANGRFTEANQQLASIQNRLKLVQAQMSMAPSGPSSPLNGPIGPQQPFQMRPLSDEIGRFSTSGRPAVGVANDLTKGVDNLGGAVRGANRPFMLLNRYVGAFGSLMAAQELMNLADSATVITNRVNVVSDSFEEATEGLNELYDIARRTRTPIEEMASLYQKGMMASEELGVSQREVLQFVEAVGMGLAVQGSSAQTARGALIQLSQAIGTDIVRAEEFNSILEGAYPIALAAANGIDEAGGSVARLRRMVIEGQVSSEQFFNAIMSQYPEIAHMFAQTEPTISQAFTVLRNELTQYISTSEEAQSISEAVASAIIIVADNIEPIADVLFALGIAWSTAFAAKNVGAVFTMATNTGLLNTAMSTLTSLLGFGGGPIVAGLALLAGAAFLVYQNTESAADKIERLREVMDASVGALDTYNLAVQRAKEEQAELGGVINLTTEAMLRQSRSELQSNLAALQTEISDMESEIGGTGLNIFNVDNVRAALSELSAMGNPVGKGWFSKDVEELYNLLEAVQNGTGSIEDFGRAVDRVRGAGPEIVKAAEDLTIAMEALPDNLSNEPSAQAQLWMQQAEDQIVAIAEAIGGLDTEISAAVNAQNLPEKVEALEALQAGLESAKFAGDLVRGSSWISDTSDLLTALQDAKDLEQNMLEALGANAERLNELAIEAEKFRKPIAGASTSSTEIEATLNEISFSPLENGARGFADQMVRAAVAAASIKEIQLNTAPAANTNAPIMASYSDNVSRSETGGLGLMELNQGGQFTVGGSGGVDQNLVAFWASRGEEVLVRQPGAKAGGGIDRTGQSEEYVSVINDINTSLDEQHAKMTNLNGVYQEQTILQEAMNMAQERGVILSREDTAAITERATGMQELQNQMSLTDEAVTSVMNNMNSAIDSFVETGKFSFKDLARSAIADLSQIGLQTFFTSPIKSIASGIIGGLAGGVSLPGFNEGADFTVGGTGGVDKNVVAFKASRGERVQVTPADQNTGGNTAPTVVFNITTPDAESFRKSETQMAARAQQMMARGQRNR